MELKKAIAVCLISLFSATLVMLIARSLDNQAAARIEPQLAQIAEELRAIRKATQVQSASDNQQLESEPAENCLMVYYFHGNTRCPTCVSIETQSHAAVLADYEARLKTGELAWKISNYEESSNAELAKKFKISMPVVVLAQRKGGKIEDWNRLDRVWALVGDKNAFAKYIHDEIEKMLARQPSPETPKADEKSIPVPDTDASNLPIPTPDSPSPDIPLPESMQ
jgi:hypothetical protein